MKRPMLITVIALAIISTTANGQATSDEIAQVQTMYGIEKRKLVSNYMKVPEAQAISFWSLYDKYESDRKELGKERFTLITRFADNYASLTDDMADEIAEGILENNIKYDKFYQSYYGKFKKVTSPITAAKFMQLELYLQNEIKSETQSAIPFIGEIEMLKVDK